MESRPDHGQERLFKEFPPITDNQWEEKLLAELKGKPLSKLDWNSPEGFMLKAYYRAADIGAVSAADDKDVLPSRRGDAIKAGNPSWQIVQAISLQSLPSATSFLQKAQAAEVKAFLLEGEGQLVPQLLPSIDLGRSALHLSVSKLPVQFWRNLQIAAIEQETNPEWITGTCFLPPFTGAPLLDPISSLQLLPELYNATEPFPYFRSIGVDVRHVLDQGGTCSQQVGIALATALEYIMHMSQQGIQTEKILPNIAFLFSTAGSFFLEVAKLRSFRMLYSRLLELLGVEKPTEYTPFILATNTSWNKSSLDRHNNLLRATTEATSAVLGGAHAVMVRPFDGKETELGYRLARNIQQLLAHEAYLGKVIDPGGGSYYLEKMTEAVAEKSWAFFQQIEEKGGLLQAHQVGFIQQALEAAKQQQLEKLLTTRQSLIGVNRYANPLEKVGELTLDHMQERAASLFEKMRKETYQLAEPRGRPFTAGLLLVGDPKMRAARATFCENVMGVIGWETEKLVWEEGNPLPDTPDIFILCSSDADYPIHVPVIIHALKEKGNRVPILIAGKTDQFTEWGASDCLYRGKNLQEFHQSLHNQISQPT
ncbi:MAG: methylmalonyl-CoA mutase family protein [Bacteroidota bacterium]